MGSGEEERERDVCEHVLKFNYANLKHTIFRFLSCKVLLDIIVL